MQLTCVKVRTWQSGAGMLCWHCLSAQEVKSTLTNTQVNTYTVYHHVLHSDSWRLRCVYEHSRILHMVGQAPHEVGWAYLPDVWTATRFGLHLSESYVFCRATLALNQTAIVGGGSPQSDWTSWGEQQLISVNAYCVIIKSPTAFISVVQ